MYPVKFSAMVAMVKDHPQVDWFCESFDILAHNRGWKKAKVASVEMFFALRTAYPEIIDYRNKGPLSVWFTSWVSEDLREQLCGFDIAWKTNRVIIGSYMLETYGDRDVVFYDEIEQYPAFQEFKDCPEVMFYDNCQD